MSKVKKFSLSFINSILLIVFLAILLIGLAISVFLTTQKIVDYNINQYFQQTNNITKIIIESEQKNLNDISFEIANVIQETGYSDDNLERNIDSIVSVDQIDLIFLERANKVTDYSNSLFDTQTIINEIGMLKILVDNTILSIKVDDEDYVIILSIKKIIDSKTGRVTGKLFTGKLLNDNFSIISRIKNKASLEEVYIYFEDSLIATTSNKEILDIALFKDDNILKRGDFLYLDKKEKIYQNKEMNIVFVTKNSTFELLKNDFKKAAYLLLVFVVILFAALHFFTNRFIISPFSRLLTFAKKTKDNESVIYKESNISEFDDFAVDLKSIIDELRELKEQYSRAIEGVEDGLWDNDLTNKKYFYSNRFLKMLGYTQEDKIDNIKFWKESIHKDDYFKTLRKLTKHIKSKTNLYEDNYRFLCKDGSYKWIKVRGKAFFDESGKIVRITGFHTDIDDIVTLQEDNAKKEKLLYQQNKLASMGEMIGNIAHQWRQPLNVISTIVSSQMIKIEMGLIKEEDLSEDLNKLNDTVQYLSSIIDKFRHFFNPNRESEEFYIDEAISENLEIFEATYSSNGIELILDLEHINILGYRFELIQVIVNIINNANDAFSDRKNIEDRKLIFIQTIKEEEFLVIRIYDNAGGIDEKLKNKIYEPYFTTKHQSQGTGLGLYMSNEIIKKHFKGELENQTIKFNYLDKEYAGEEFRVKIPMG